MPARILIVDDDRRIADSLGIILRSAGHECSVAYSASEAILKIAKFQPQLVISDVIMPGRTGLDLASELRTHMPHIPVILLSGNAGTEELLKESSIQCNGVIVLAKPFPPREMLRIVGEMTASLAA